MYVFTLDFTEKPTCQIVRLMYMVFLSSSCRRSIYPIQTYIDISVGQSGEWQDTYVTTLVEILSFGACIKDDPHHPHPPRRCFGFMRLSVSCSGRYCIMAKELTSSRFRKIYGFFFLF